MIDNELSAFYEELYGRPLAEPGNEQDTKNILSCIRARHGYLDSEDDTLLQGTTSILHKKVSMIASNSRKVLAQFTKAISSQLYDDPFRFFFELLQNADDAKYSRTSDMPAILFTVSPTELTVDLNEDGFTLSDVLSICHTGQSSKELNEESTGEKGFGFKAVFGIADQVHIRSGLWSFRFEHQRHEDGIDMISPIWEPGEKLPDDVRTRFRLRYSSPEGDGLTDLCKWLEDQHPSVVFALRKLKKVSIDFRNVQGRNYTICFDKSVGTTEDVTTIISRVAGKATEHVYRTFIRTAKDMPKQVERPRPVSTIKIGFPVTAQKDGLPKITANGNFVFAYLPIIQMAQLPFLIHADFLLPGSRQAVIDNPWNKRLRDEVTYLFALAVRDITHENSRLSYEWLAYLPVQPINGFWQPLQGLIKRHLSGQKTFYSRDGTLHESSMLRVLPKDFMHGDEPLLPESKRPWHFISAKYGSFHISALKSLGVEDFSYNDAFDLLDDDISSNSSILRTKPWQNMWHNSFMAFIQRALNQSTPTYKDRLHDKCIVPVRVKDKLEWWRPWQNVYFPTIVEEGTGSEQVRIEMPMDINLVVLHPDAAAHSSRRQVYQLLGVRHCSSAVICSAIEKAQNTPGSKFPTDLLSSLELLFWFSHKFSVGAQYNLVASTSAGVYTGAKRLFMRSDQPYHAERLLRLAENPQYKEHFLNQIYQASPVSTRSRGGLTWEQWLCDVAGVRWYPPLQDSQNRNKLHWMIETIRRENSSMFAPMIQNYWSQEYGHTCRFNAKIKQALMECKVICQHDGFEELQKTWFPTRPIVDTAREYGFEKKLPILTLPESPEDYLVSQWPSLSDLGVRSALDLSFYRQALSLLSAAGEAPEIGAVRMGWLYKDMGGRATLEDQAALQAEFRDKPIVWDPTSSKWRTLDECVWKSRIALKCKFVLTSRYDESAISGLFQTLLKTSDVTLACLIDELQYMQGLSFSELGETLLNRASAIYTSLKDMINTAENKQWLRFVFKDKALVYSSNTNNWLKPTSCIWHTTIEIGNYVPIAATYPDLEEFFVNILGVSTVTDAFMMKQLAAAATKREKNADDIKKLMLSTSELLNPNSQGSEFDKSMEILQKSKYLPCKSPQGDIEFRSATETFHIVDNQYYAEKFDSKLIMLDFTYEQLISLHELFRILRLDDHYLTRNVRYETSADSSDLDEVLTEQFRQCAYAISCCAISHRSPMYSNQNKQMYNDLVTATVRTSSDISAKLVVIQDKTSIMAESAKASMIIERNQDGLLVILPGATVEKKQCMRGQLPGLLADLLQIYDSRGEKQIYRITNELDVGTDEILLDEEISRVSWLAETSRPAPTSQPEPHETQPHSSVGQASGAVGGGTQALPQDGQTFLEIHQLETTIRAAGSISINNSSNLPPPFRALPATLNHEVDAPHYWKVLDHVAKQAASVGDQGRNIARATSDDITRAFASLTLQSTSFDPADYPSLFGSDFWLSKFRIGAAGELFVYEILRRLSLNGFWLENWESKIRHLVQAHEQYRHVSRREQREIADITYRDQGNVLGTLFRSKSLGDVFPDWQPGWLANLRQDENQSLEWLFEVKTSIGPCETDFYMSKDQYELMRGLSEESDSTRRRVYCIVRVYNLLSDQIGISFFIDPWRFREGRLEFGTTDKWKVRASS